VSFCQLLTITKASVPVRDGLRKVPKGHDRITPEDLPERVFHPRQPVLPGLPNRSAYPALILGTPSAFESVRKCTSVHGV